MRSADMQPRPAPPGCQARAPETGWAAREAGPRARSVARAAGWGRQSASRPEYDKFGLIRKHHGVKKELTAFSGEGTKLIPRGSEPPRSGPAGSEPPRTGPFQE